MLKSIHTKMNPFWTKLAIKVSITLGILLALSLVILWVGKDIEAHSADIFKLNQDLNSRSASLSEIARLKAAAAEIPPLLEKLKKALPGEDELPVLKSDLGETAKLYDLGYISKFGISAVVSEGLKSIVFEINLQGSYENIVKFVGDMETNGRFIGVTNIDIAQQNDKYTATINTLIYYSDAKKVQ